METQSTFDSKIDTEWVSRAAKTAAETWNGIQSQISKGFEAFPQLQQAVSAMNTTETALVAVCAVLGFVVLLLAYIVHRKNTIITELLAKRKGLLSKDKSDTESDSD